MSGIRQISRGRGAASLPPTSDNNPPRNTPGVAVRSQTGPDRTWSRASHPEDRLTHTLAGGSYVVPLCRGRSSQIQRITFQVLKGRLCPARRQKEEAG